ncbi:receptor-type tyrosine-protein phosphatase N2 isoform X2 [Syngnathus scovelli]|uniref:receptor-type tyrosine-protein phosphatase N2 isoform X2 n=1 Tax=Syngnathus scovelli TaxID=161590 RepID=UPI00210FD845|nr:receptor-type tyrosine-protein phosphatase N2 isoform X2 [Syngnathus scovelli]
MQPCPFFSRTFPHHVSVTSHLGGARPSDSVAVLGAENQRQRSARLGSALLCSALLCSAPLLFCSHFRFLLRQPPPPESSEQHALLAAAIPPGPLPPGVGRSHVLVRRTWIEPSGGMESLQCPMLVLALAGCLCCFAPARADGSFGCRFEDDLCQAYEFCVNDGVFGRCQQLAGADLNTYDVSSSGLLRLRTLLQKLAHRGLAWQDDITQQAVSGALSKLRSGDALGHQEASEVPLGSYGGTAGRKERPGEAELSRNLQRFLKGSRFPPRLQPGVQQEAASTRNEGVSDYDERGPPKSAWKETSVYSLQKAANQAPITKIFSQSGEGRHPELSAPYRPLSNHLGQLLTQGGPTGSKGKLRYLGYVRPPPDEVHLAFGPKSPKAKLDGLLFRSGSDRPTAEKPPHFTNDLMIQDMVNRLGGHGLNMEPWMAKDLEQLASIISGALRGAQAGQPQEEDADLRADVEPDQVLSVKAEKVNNRKDPWTFGQGQREDGAANKNPVDEHTAIFSKLLNYLDKMGDSSEVQPAPAEKAAGLESVRSRTTQEKSKASAAAAGEGSASRLSGGALQQARSQMETWMQKPAANDIQVKTQLVHVGVKEFSSRGKDRHFGYIITGSDSLTSEQAVDLMERLTRELHLHAADLTQLSVLGPALTFRVGPNSANVTTADLVTIAVRGKKQLEKETGLKIVEAGVSDRGSLDHIPVVKETRVESGQLAVLSVLCVLFILVVLAVSAIFFCVRQRSHLRMKEKLSGLGTDTSSDATATYQSYMEDHLKNKNRLEREWEALCSYQAEPGTCSVARSEPSTRKNRSDAALAYDHSRITLKAENNHSGSDYINASPIMDHDPRNPTYIASQGPLPSTVADFWQMVWESGCVVVLMLTPVSENGVKQCHRYWPDEGSDVYHFYEVNLVSEHIWCEDFLVRSFYLKNLHTNETRTVTQFHFLSWMDHGVPSSARTLLDFRRKVNKCYRGRSCPIIVHCSDGAGRSGTYILIDMVLNRMAKGAKEIDIAATLEHLRDQRAGMVHTKEQFEFALTAVAEEVNAILKAMPQ